MGFGARNLFRRGEFVTFSFYSKRQTRQDNANASLFSTRKNEDAAPRREGGKRPRTEERQKRVRKSGEKGDARNACTPFLDNSGFYCIIPHFPTNKGASQICSGGRVSVQFARSVVSCLSSPVFRAVFNSDKLFHGLAGVSLQSRQLLNCYV